MKWQRKSAPRRPNRNAATGVAGLDDVLSGGLAQGRTFLIEGKPGTGKTTIALEFLRAGAAVGERCLYITLSETENELRSSAASHGWKLDGIHVYELLPPENLLSEDQQQSLLYSSDLELGETTRRIFAAFRCRETRSGRAGQPFGDPVARTGGHCAIAARSWR
jgi:circadian clock protein KaiC